jgi:hypothetical protein
VVGVVFVIGTLAGASPVRGACGLTEEAVANAPVVFVGALTAVTPDGRTGTFLVEDVWRGEGLQAGTDVDVSVVDGGVPATVQMPPDGTQHRFLVLAKEVQSGELVTGGSCSNFAYPWDDSYAAFGPTQTASFGIGNIALLAAMAAVVVGLFAVALRRTRLVP